eukprot:scaffold868_cov249-Pinguiococcus_pyrenoidosus.AAC.10
MQSRVAGGPAMSDDAKQWLRGQGFTSGLIGKLRPDSRSCLPRKKGGIEGRAMSPEDRQTEGRESQTWPRTQRLERISRLSGGQHHADSISSVHRGQQRLDVRERRSSSWYATREILSVTSLLSFSLALSSPISTSTPASHSLRSQWASKCARALDGRRSGTAFASTGNSWNASARLASSASSTSHGRRAVRWACTDFQSLELEVDACFALLLLLPPGCQFCNVGNVEAETSDTGFHTLVHTLESSPTGGTPVTAQVHEVRRFAPGRASLGLKAEPHRRDLGSGAADGGGEPGVSGARRKEDRGGDHQRRHAERR